MFEKVFIIFLFLIATIEAGGKCPDDTGAAALNCTLVPGCQFAENATLTTLATQCSDELSSTDCQQLFPCDSASTTHCRDPAAIGGLTPEEYPFVRAPACLSPALQDIALKCK